MLGKQVHEAEEGGADYIHIDIMDGQFVPALTFGPAIVKSIRSYTSIPFDIHMMVYRPERYISELADAGADIITIHPEATDNLISSIEKIKSFKKKAGVSLNPETSVDKVLPVLNLIDFVLIMSVNPGFGGQKFIENTLNKVRVLRKEIDKKKLTTEIEIDVGINFENSKKAREAGVNILVSGTTIFKENKGNLKKNIQLLRAG